MFIIMSLPQPNILQLAHQMADKMTKDDSVDLENMDMESMISHVTKNVMGMMQNDNFMKTMEQTTAQMQKPQTTDDDIEVEDMDENEDEDFLNPRTKDLNFNLNVSLKDLYTGKKKKISVRRKRLKKTPSGYKIVEEKKKIGVEIKRGMKDQQILRYNKEADELPGHEPGDIVITICEDEPQHFERDGNDLFMLKTISLTESFELNWSFRHLDNHVVQVSYKGEKPLHLEDGLRKIEGEGMPIFEKDQNKPTEYGDLYIQFRVVLPDTITPENLLILQKICIPLLTGVKVGEEDKIVKKSLVEVSEEERLAFGEDLTDDEDESDYSDLSEDETEEEDEEDEGEEITDDEELPVEEED